MAVLRRRNAILIVRTVRLLGCVVIAIGCIYLCIAFARLVDSSNRTGNKPLSYQPGRREVQLNEMLSAELNDLICRPWVVDDSGWEWQITSEAQKHSTLLGNSQLDHNLVATSKVNDRQLIDSLIAIGAKSTMSLTGKSELKLLLGEFAISAAILNREGTPEITAFSVEPVETKKDASRLLLRKKHRANSSTPQTRMPLPESCRGILSQYSDTGELTTNLVEGMVWQNCLHLWGNRGYTVVRIEFGLLPPDTYLVSISGQSFLVWYPMQNNWNSLGIIRAIPEKLAKPLSSHASLRVLN